LIYRAWSKENIDVDQSSPTPQQYRQLRDVGRDAPRFIPREQVCARPTTRLVLILQVCKRLPVVIADDEAGAVVLNLPPRRKATVRHNAAIEHIMRPRLGVNRACMMP
jgi:hypothetical protein